MRARIACGLAVLFLLSPLIWPVAVSLSRPGVGRAWCEFDRIVALLQTSAALVGITLALSLPSGLCLGLLAFTSDAAGARAARWILLLGVAIPLPLFAVAWVGVMAPWAAWSPFPEGLASAAIVHALAAMPWIAVLTGVAVRSIDPALFDDVRTSSKAGPARLVVAIARRALPLAATWVAIITLTEIAVTDMFRVRTFAEEVFAQLTAPTAATGDSADDAVARAVVVCLPLPLLLAAIVGLGGRWCPSWTHLNLPRPVSAWNVPRIAAIGLWLGVLAPVLIPIVFLAIRASAIPVDLDQAVVRLIPSLAVAAAAGAVASMLSLWLTFGLKRYPVARGTLFAAAVLTLATPGPLLGLGVKQMIQGGVVAEKEYGIECLTPLLYDGPSAAPVFWAYLLRALPIALLVVAPVVAANRRDLEDAARMDSGRTARHFRHVALPQAGYAAVFVALLTTSLCLGEVGVSRLVATPGGQTVAHELFTRMHYGVRADVAALGLGLFACAAVPVAVAAVIARFAEP